VKREDGRSRSKEELEVTIAGGGRKGGPIELSRRVGPDSIVVGGPLSRSVATIY
jgi:hypothetical protein